MKQYENKTMKIKVFFQYKKMDIIMVMVYKTWR